MSKKSKGNLRATNIISNSVDLALDNLKDLGILAVIFQLIPMIIVYLMGISFAVSTASVLSRYQNRVSLLGDTVIMLLLIAAIGIWTTIGSFAIVKFVHMRNTSEEFTWKESLKFAISRVGKIILFVIFTFMISIAAAIVFIIIAFIGTIIVEAVSKLAAFLGVLIVILGIIGAVILIIWFTIYIIFMMQGMAIHEMGVWDSFKYGITMLNGRLLDVFKKELLIYIIIIIVGLVLNVLNLIPFIGPIIMSIGSIAITIYESICNTIIFDDYDECDRSI